MDKDGKGIVPKNTAIILGLVFSSNMLWNNYLEIGQKALIPNLKKKLGALKFTSNLANFQTKKCLIDGIIMSKIVYGICVWGLSASASMVRKVQGVQNLSMRWLLNENRYTKVETLLKRYSFLSVYQLTIYHCILQFWKVLNYGVPVRMAEWVDINTEGITRIHQTGEVWSKVAPAYFERLDINLKIENKISIFKTGLKRWILQNVPIHKPYI